jgi:cytochrome c-type biogenesis protein CcmH/NrfG
MPDLLILLVALAVGFAVVLLPLRQRPHTAADDESDAAELRHRVALEALRDVEADRRAGSLDDAAYTIQLAQAEARAVETRRSLEELPGPVPVTSGGAGRRTAVVAAAVIGVVLASAWAVPATGVANRTATNQALAAAEAAEQARQDRIRDLTEELAATPDDPEVLSELADAFLAGQDREDLARAVVVLQALLAVEPDRPDAYERMISAYLRAGDAANARAAHDSYAQLGSADPVELAFLDGLIARAEGDAERAVEAFDRFLELAPDDPRADMIRGLREEAAGD